MLVYSIPPIAYFSANGVPATGSRALFQSLLYDLYFLRIKTFAIQHLPWFACLVGSDLLPFDPTLRFGVHRVWDTASRAILKVSFADPILCRSNVVFWPPHGFAGIVIDKFCQQSSQSLHSGVNSVWATVFGRLLSIACGNIVPFKVREPAFAGFLSICSRASSFDPQIRVSASYDQIPAPFESVSSYFGGS
jgi:hypothetical protein